MTAVSLTISPAPPVNPGLDYSTLVADGIELIQQLAGEIWDEYNESDPGVTTLEQVCYALTELSYRAEFPLEDLLIPHPDGRIHPRRQALYPALRIFPCNPVTDLDLRKLLLDRIPELGNVWLRPHQPRNDKGVNGLYDVVVYAPSLPPPPCTPAEDERRLRERVQSVYVRHRELCEDLRTLTILRPEKIVVSADIGIGDQPRPEAILANLLFRTGNLLAPEPRRQSLSMLMEQQKQPSAIFNGPLLLNGFIADDELQPKATSIRMQDVIRTLTRTTGVLSVRNARSRIGDKVYGPNESIPVPDRDVLRLDTLPDSRGVFSIRLYRNGLEVTPDPMRVRRELDHLWAEQRRRYRLSEQYEQYFGFPTGTWRNVEQYYSIQNQFPNTYGINAYGVPSPSPPSRQAQARQFKGYLLVFDQLLANFFAQLAHVHELYSTDAAVNETYFYQSLEKSVPNVEPLLMPDYREGLARIVNASDPVVERRSRFVDFLLALYAEKLDASDVWTLRTDDEQSTQSAARLLKAKLDLLRRMVPVTHNRGRGIDYLERPSRGNMAGMEMKIRIQLGMDVLDVRPLSEVAGEMGVQFATRESEATVGRPLPRHAELIEEQFAPVAITESDVPGAPCTIPESLLAAGGSLEELRVGRLPGDSAYSVVWRASGDPEWRLAGKHADRDRASTAASAFASMLGKLHRHSQQLYIVEHTLLRFGRFRKRSSFPYSFTATAVLSPPARLRRDSDYRRFARETIRANAPAHVVMNDLFIGPLQMWLFEPLYWAWRRALRGQNRGEMAVTSFLLREFLELHRQIEGAS